MQALSMLSCLCACGNSETGKETNSPTEKVEDAQPSNVETISAVNDFVFTYKGIGIEMNAHADGILEALGEPKRYTEENSCAFEGMDKTYYDWLQGKYLRARDLAALQEFSAGYLMEYMD